VTSREDADHQLLDDLVLSDDRVRDLLAKVSVGFFQLVEAGQVRLVSSGHVESSQR
jgi:hypothetical protein